MWHAVLTHVKTIATGPPDCPPQRYSTRFNVCTPLPSRGTAVVGSPNADSSSALRAGVERGGVFSSPVGSRLGHSVGGGEDLAELPTTASLSEAVQEDDPGAGLPMLAQQEIVRPMEVVAQPGPAADTADQATSLIRVGAKGDAACLRVALE